ncbi:MULTISPECIES: SDR family NAD(P)-dependent oxidoreductase [Aequorivita]|uniref:SDR family NAD(P)-dependent oxidoreductase n=1 Tax=Aequorivita TaxID=153265 RepID=UPI001CE31FD5|nr:MULTISPECIES: SDR family oxidoreductase [Aequorivita]UCA54957.1 SDR family oxidoreductase [Aequorivita sp. F7]
MKLTEKIKQTALVTGAASGLGFELAMLLAQDGYDLFLVDVDIQGLEKAKKEIETQFSSEVKLIAKDLSTCNVAPEIFEAIEDVPIDVLINNAGFGIFGSFQDTDWKREAEMLNLHVVTTTHLTKLVLKGMVARGKGKILNMSSLAAFQPGPLMSLYYASKAYILSFSEAIANELKDSGVTVTVLCPGQTKTCFQDVVSNGIGKSSSENKISFNIACPKAVAKYGYEAMQKGKIVAIPGNINKLLSKLPRFVSRRTATAVIRRIQEKNRAH